MYDLMHNMSFWHVAQHYLSLSCICLLCVGKVLIIGGGIANFTNVAATFKVSMVQFFLQIFYMRNIVRLSEQQYY